METPDRFMNTKSTPPAQPSDTANNGDIVTRARGNRRVDATTISDIARLCAKQLTESEACRRLGVKPRHWFDWKTRHNRSAKFTELLEAFRADRIDSLVTKIEQSADGIGLKQPDWRAAAALLKFADVTRFGDRPIELNVNNQAPWHALSDQRMKQIFESVYEDRKKAGLPVPGVVTVEPAPAPKQIQDAEIISEQVKANEHNGNS